MPFELLTPDGVILALIKPQFELAREDVGRGGIVRSTELHEKAQQKVAAFAEAMGARVGGLFPSTHRRHRWQPGIFHMSPKTIGLIAHTGKPGAAELVRAARGRNLPAFRLPVKMETETARIAGQKSSFPSRDLGRETDLLVVLGGDGTILNVVGKIGRLHQADLRNQHRFVRLSHLS